MKTRIGRALVTYLWLGSLAMAIGLCLTAVLIAGLTGRRGRVAETQSSPAVNPFTAAPGTSVYEGHTAPAGPPLRDGNGSAIEFPVPKTADHNETVGEPMKGGAEEVLTVMPALPGVERAVRRVRAGGTGAGEHAVAARGGGGALQGPRFAPGAAAEGSGADEYRGVPENAFVSVAGSEPSTFSVDVDTASYSNIRRFVREGRMPPRDAVRIEEMLNAFRYDDAPPRDGAPFAVTAEMHPAPWAREHHLVRIGLRAKDIDIAEAPPANLVFLIDVSGSMAPEDRLPLVKRCLKMMVGRLRAQDRVSLVTYAGQSGLVMDATPGSRKAEIFAAIDRLGAGGSTNGAAGIHQAYETAKTHFVDGGINRVILCTDGDFNVGVSNLDGLGKLIEEKRATGVFLSVMGFGRGNLADARMQELAQKGNGNAAYIDRFSEGRRVFVEQMSGTLMTVAKDVKIQVEFNPEEVESYRLIGYETRKLAAKDFADDTKDAGEIGAGHQVVALYEVVPACGGEARARRTPGKELCTIRLRYKPADGEVSSKIEFTLGASAKGKATPEFDFAAAVAACGMLLKDSPHRGTATWGLVQELAQGGVGEDPGGARQEFVGLVKSMRLMAENEAGGAHGVPTAR